MTVNSEGRQTPGRAHTHRRCEATAHGQQQESLPAQESTPQQQWRPLVLQTCSGTQERGSTQADTQGRWYLASQPHLPGSWTSSPAPACLAGRRPARGGCSNEGLLHSPSTPSVPLTMSKDSLSSCQQHQSPHRAMQCSQGAARHSMWTARGMGWACSLTQPALGTTAQLDRAATCRWAGESNEREC